MNRNKRLGALALMLCTALLLGGCATASTPPTDSQPETPVQTVDSISLTDSATIYQDDDEDSIVTMYLTVRQGNETDNANHTWTEVNAHSTYYYQELGIDKYRVNGILQVGDETGPVMGMFGFGEYYPNCTVQIRGQTSTRSPQKSYKIELNKGEGYWREQRTIVLNKHVYDTIRFRNKLSYDLLKTLPDAFSARTQFVRLYVKDETETTGGGFQDYGLYTQVEQINKTYLRNHGLDENGQLYKAAMFEFLRYPDSLKLKTDADYDKTAFEKVLEIKGNDDHTKLLQMLDDLSDYSIPIETVLETHFDEANYFTWLAFQLLTGNIDTNSQNFYLYSPQNGTKWYFISWDNDAAWSYGEDVTVRDRPGGYNYSLGVSNYWGCELHRRVLKSPILREKLKAKMDELYQLITRERITKLATTYSNLTRPFLSRLPDQLHAPVDMDKFERIIATVPDEMDYNYRFFNQSLTYPMPFFVDNPENLDGKTVFSWNPAYDFAGEPITYQFALSQDYTFATTLSVQKDLSIPQASVPELAPGQYFFKVTCENASGKTQTAMEIYEGMDNIKRYGVAECYVNPDGSILLK